VWGVWVRGLLCLAVWIGRTSEVVPTEQPGQATFVVRFGYVADRCFDSKVCHSGSGGDGEESNGGKTHRGGVEGM
jgi:hypothetical protein